MGREKPFRMENGWCLPGVLMGMLKTNRIFEILQKFIHLFDLHFIVVSDKTQISVQIADAFGYNHVSSP